MKFRIWISLIRLLSQWLCKKKSYSIKKLGIFVVLMFSKGMLHMACLNNLSTLKWQLTASHRVGTRTCGIPMSRNSSVIFFDPLLCSFLYLPSFLVVCTFFSLAMGKMKWFKSLLGLLGQNPETSQSESTLYSCPFRWVVGCDWFGIFSPSSYGPGWGEGNIQARGLMLISLQYKPVWGPLLWGYYPWSSLKVGWQFWQV